jgi:hypothetical protein
MSDFMKIAFLLEEMGVPFKKICTLENWNIYHGYEFLLIGETKWQLRNLL